MFRAFSVISFLQSLSTVNVYAEVRYRVHKHRSRSDFRYSDIKPRLSVNECIAVYQKTAAGLVLTTGAGAKRKEVIRCVVILPSTATAFSAGHLSPRTATEKQQTSG